MEIANPRGFRHGIPANNDCAIVKPHPQFDQQSAVPSPLTGVPGEKQ
jgi:hypothetical protein